MRINIRSCFIPVRVSMSSRRKNNLDLSVCNWKMSRRFKINCHKMGALSRLVKVQKMDIHHHVKTFPTRRAYKACFIVRSFGVFKIECLELPLLTIVLVGKLLNLRQKPNIARRRFDDKGWTLWLRNIKHLKLNHRSGNLPNRSKRLLIKKSIGQ